MKRWIQPFAVAIMVISTPAVAQEAVGDWQGTLDVGGTKLRLVIHVQTGTNGKLTGTLDSLDQSSFGIPLGDVSLEGDRLTIAVPSLSGSYAGQWDEGTKGWRGFWSQGGASLPLALAPGGPPPEEPRAPEPLPAAAAVGRRLRPGPCGPRPDPTMSGAPVRRPRVPRVRARRLRPNPPREGCHPSGAAGRRG